MIFLNKGLFAPFVILLSIVFAPLMVICVVSVFFGVKLHLLVAFFVVFGIYCIGVLAAYKSSKSQKNNLQVVDEKIIINYPNSNRESQELVLLSDEIVKIEYYRLGSIRAWLLLHSYLLPQCAFLTYVCEGKEVCKHIGYPDYQEIRTLCRRMNIDLIIK